MIQVAGLLYAIDMNTREKKKIRSTLFLPEEMGERVCGEKKVRDIPENEIRTESAEQALAMIESGGYSLTREQGCAMFHIHLETWAATFHQLKELRYVSLRGSSKMTTSKGFVVRYGPDYLNGRSAPAGYYHYNLEDLHQYVLKNLILFRRTKRIILDQYVKNPNAWDPARKQLRSSMPLQGEMNAREYRREWLAWRKNCTKTLKEHLPEKLHFILDERIGSDNRTAQEWIEVTDSHELSILREAAWKGFLSGECSSPATDRKYGEAAVSGYRLIHALGYIKMELPVGEKKIIRYMEDPYFKPDDDDLFEATISWDSWLKMKKAVE